MLNLLIVKIFVVVDFSDHHNHHQMLISHFFVYLFNKFSEYSVYLHNNKKNIW